MQEVNVNEDKMPLHYERIRAGSIEYEVKGTAEYVERRMDQTIDRILTIAAMQATVEPDDLKLASGENEDTPTLADVNVSEMVSEIKTEQSAKSLDLCTFYSMKAPKGRYEELLVITYYFTEVAQTHSVMSYKDYDAAYEELRELALDKPGNIRTSARNAKANKFLFSPRGEDGKFALTQQGKQFVSDMKA